MNGVITEKDYPIQAKWVFKVLIRSILSFLPLPLFYLYYVDAFSKLNSSVIIIIFVGIQPLFIFIISLLRRKFFHYSIEDKFLTLRQGVISKQERHIPYGVIQNIVVNQGILDKLFSIASLSVENASQAGGGGFVPPQPKFFGMKLGSKEYTRPEMIGSMGNRVDIPGLKMTDAETLKGIIMKKMKDNPIEDNQSGL